VYFHTCSAVFAYRSRSECRVNRIKFMLLPGCSITQPSSVAAGAHTRLRMFCSPNTVVFHDLVNPCPTTSLTLSHVKKQGHRGSSVGGSFSCGRSGAIRNFKGMGRKTQGPLASRPLANQTWTKKAPTRKRGMPKSYTFKR
jgi:hypothetical protein